MARQPSAVCIEGKGWNPCFGCGEQPELAPSPFGSTMARCFTNGCKNKSKEREGGWQLAEDWQALNAADRTEGA